MENQNRPCLTWNTRVTLRPNSLGWQMWENYYRALGLVPPAHDAELRIQLWEAIDIFGSNISTGRILPFEDTVIEW